MPDGRIWCKRPPLRPARRPSVCRADVTSEQDVAALVARTMEAFGQIDVMVNNAAVPGTDKFIWEQTLENWNSTIAVDITGAMLCTREVLNASMMERRQGSIINFSSAAGYTAPHRKSHYVTAKAALRAFTKAVAKRDRPAGGAVQLRRPGSIDTELLRNYHARIAASRASLRGPTGGAHRRGAVTHHFHHGGRGQPGAISGQRRKPNHHRAIHRRGCRRHPGRRLTPASSRRGHKAASSCKCSTSKR